MLAPHMRAVPLTPMLPLAIPIDDERSRQSLFLAFKAASIVLAKIQADVSRLVQETLPEIPLEMRGFPSVTGIEAINPSSPRINFTLLARHDTKIDYRNLYHAKTVPEGEEIYVKFTKRYSRDLHLFCANRGLAPKLLGFERLPGGWFGLAMEKVDVLKLTTVESLSSLSEFGNWKKDIWKLVKDFHQEGLVHGDLRRGNFIFTKSKPCKMLLVDFDWGGKDGEVCFPRGELAEELRAPYGQGDVLDRAITKEDDNRVLAGAFKPLEEIFDEWSRWRRSNGDMDSVGHT